MPIQLALVDKEGGELADSAQVFQLKEAAADLVFENLPKPPAFASINRDYSFYGTFQVKNVTSETLVKQILLDPNAYNRVEAMRQLTDRQRIRLLEDPDAAIDPEWLSVFGEILGDEHLPRALKAYFLRIDEQPLERQYCTWYQELVAAREKLMLAANRMHRDGLLVQFEKIDTYTLPAGRSPKYGIEDRLLKNVLLDLIAIDDSAESHQLLLDHYRKATTATDRVAALLALNRSSSPARRTCLRQHMRRGMDTSAATPTIFASSPVARERMSFP